MSPFGLYARYYDLLYRDKDYAAEAGFVSGQLRVHAPDARSMLELGCGTGRHAFALAQLDWRVTGVDLSAGMVAEADARRDAAVRDLAARVDFSQGDARSVRLNRQFDAVVSLFHVMSYQIRDADLDAAIATAVAHLRPGGLFFFDFWHGPAVLADPPVIRIKRLQGDDLEVTRIAEPLMRPGENGVRVDYQIFLKDNATGRISELREQHPMRYLFLPEIVVRLQRHGLELRRSSAWMEAGRPLGPDTWYGCVLAQRAEGRS